MGYADQPDGKDCFEKVSVVARYSGCLGLVLSTYDVLMVTKPQGYVPTLAKYIQVTFPLAAAGATFAAVTCVSTNLRNKDDGLNYFLGGNAAGSVIGAAKRSFRVGIPLGFALGCIAVLYKDGKDHGYQLIPKFEHKMGGMDYRKYDFTFTKDK
ncbi:NADH dehydrogenase [ubiquinone] 1 alpha subcomplex subunit 11 [Procambarus clarkii]|uniref:NADH dehydrogenase [ubiquinone] 1 alpha subcomplex subunit 11 n=1 Tax=Procambarus clarkii TaxID=6728 RepID=UPI001E677166|nr:NADH dehydrogenase [ubiquinone] 1 alpha subcomplex subunit 11-like [Procambarus clarkii]